MATNVTQLRKKQVVSHKGEPHVIVDYMLKTPPNMAAHVQMTLKNLRTGVRIPLHCSVKESYDVMHFEEKQLEYSYEADGMFTFMDTESFEQYDLGQDKIEDDAIFLVEGQKYGVLMVDGAPMALNLPASVVMKVVHSPEGLKGDSSGSVTKPAEVETGMTIQVPLFIKEGELVKVNTADKSYMGRA